MTPEEIEAILDAYEAWDETQQTVDEFAASIGVTKSNLYRILRRENVIPKSRRLGGGSEESRLEKRVAILERRIHDLEARVGA